MISIFYYGMGNIHSISGALSYLKAPFKIITDTNQITKSDKIILPGVGSYRAAMDNIVNSGAKEALREAVLEKKIPLLGICLGMQIITSFGDEGGGEKGLELIEGHVEKFNSLPFLKIPHIGFNSIIKNGNTCMFKGIDNETDFYFIHSYCLKKMDEKYVAAYTSYSEKFISAIESEHIWGCQFHPEKSQKNGLRVLENFIRF